MELAEVSAVVGQGCHIRYGNSIFVVVRVFEVVERMVGWKKSQHEDLFNCLI
jgi:hypothetical protein